MEESLLDLSFLDNDEEEETVVVEQQQEEEKIEPIKRTVSKQTIGEDEDAPRENGNGKKRRRMKRKGSDYLSDQEDIEKALSSEQEEDEFFGHSPGSKEFMETCLVKVSEILQNEKESRNNKKRAKKRVISDEEETPEQATNSVETIPVQREPVTRSKYPFAEFFDHLDGETLKSSKYVMPRKFAGEKELRTRLSKNRILVNPNAIVLLVMDIEKELNKIQPQLKAASKSNIIRICDSISASVAGSRDQSKLNFAYKYLTEMLDNIQSYNSN